MRRNLALLTAGISISISVLLLAGPAGAGGDKGQPFQFVVPKEIHQELVKREADLIRELLKGTPSEKAISRAKFAAIFIASCPMPAKDGKPVYNEVVLTALALARTLNEKGGLDAARKLADALVDGKPVQAVGALVPANWIATMQLIEMMNHYLPKDKGGDGMHADLQSNIRLKGALNGIEEKIRALTMKEMNAANLKKEAKELELLGYHTAVVGSLTYHYAPAKKVGTKDPEEWRKLSLQMRDQSVSLAVAANKSDAGGVLKAGSSLYSTCNQCHTVFK